MDFGQLGVEWWSSVVVGVLALVLALVKRGGSGQEELQKQIESLQKELGEVKTREQAQQTYVQQLLDRIIAAEQENKEIRSELESLKRERERLLALIEVQRKDGHDHILVVTGPDPDLQRDLSAFHRVQTTTGLRYARMSDATTRGFERYTERWRMQRHPVKYVHLALHMASDGAEFKDKVVTGLWLSEQLRDCKILVLDGCDSEDLGDLIRAVEVVISMRHSVENHDAALWAEAFWEEIGLGADPQQAYWSALSRVPTAVREHVEIHF